MTVNQIGDDPQLSAVVVHWRNEEQLARLLAAWPRADRFELLVVDNSRTLGELKDGPWPGFQLIVPGKNLGFAGGVNRGVAAARAPIVLVLNPDLVPEDGALDALLDGFTRFVDAAGLAPALVAPGGESQHAWQLRPLPSPGQLLLQTFFLSGVRGPREEPADGAAVEQPAGAALALRRDVLTSLGGLDEGFYPAWFEDVDLARRLAAAGHVVRYCSASRWTHEGGGSVSALGYGPFLWIYYRNLGRYLRRHHGPVWALAARILVIVGMGLRLLFLPFRRPRRARSRRQAAAALLQVMAGAISGWRRPARLARESER